MCCVEVERFEVDCRSCGLPRAHCLALSDWQDSTTGPRRPWLHGQWLIVNLESGQVTVEVLRRRKISDEFCSMPSGTTDAGFVVRDPLSVVLILTPPRAQVVRPRTAAFAMSAITTVPDSARVPPRTVHASTSA